jgi:ABC-type uncharacterized transport system permease subunit
MSAVQLLYYLVFGPWKSPTSMGQVSADGDVPRRASSLPLHRAALPWSMRAIAIVALVVALLAWLVMSRSLFGFSGARRRQRRRTRRAMAGSRTRTRRSGSRMLSGWRAGGACGHISRPPDHSGALVPEPFPSNYGFTAIIVAFLGRLHPVGIVFAALVHRDHLRRRRGGADRRSGLPLGRVSASCRR